MARDNAPVPHTCPLIDKVISAINYVDWEDTHWEYEDLINTMEEIRKANESLRTWGNEKYNEVYELEDKISDLEKDLRDKNNEIDGLMNKIKDMEIEISKLEDKLYKYSNS